ncbi:hypothetical protein RHIZ404_220088 [Rhizobium sp. EC-SD404]|nr:hypothetical protein RHIZ404_220088 [Rhizobium sp. EC-SD404]
MMEHLTAIDTGFHPTDATRPHYIRDSLIEAPTLPKLPS